MLNRMRWRFIGAAMAAFSAVILILLCFVNGWNFRNIIRQQDETLQMLLEAEDPALSLSETSGKPPFETWGPFSQEIPYMIRFFSVRYDDSGTIVRINQDYIASISEADAGLYAAQALSSGKDRGLYNGYRYLVSRGEGETTVLFLNSEKELEAARSLLWIGIIIAGVCLTVVFLLVILFSKRATAPYLRNLEMQKQFITNASHELKTPLTAISTSADVLAMEYSGNEWVENIRMQAGKLSKLITNLVTLSRLDEENPFPERLVFSLSDALWETAESFSALARATGKRYTQNITDGLTMTGDRAAIQQMISILLDNAVKYSPQKGSICLLASRSGRRNMIEISNTCGGTQAGDVSHLFERFYRADESHSNAVGGTGIGLSIAKATVEAHGGTIRARQENGRMVFVICL